MRVERINAVQAHYVPNRIVSPRGPFPPELFVEPEIVDNYLPAFNEDGQGFEPGSTAQNNFQPPRWLRCGDCYERVLETETEEHICEE
jgi:hypothetical protein